MMRRFAQAIYRVQRYRHQGQVLILAGIAMTVLLGFVAVSVDVGYALTERRQVQTAVDSAALAAANAALANATDAVVISTAKMYGADNAGVSADDVSVQRPPTSGEHAGDRNFIQVTINKDVPRFFINAVYHGSWSVGATAVSGLVPAGFNAAILALNNGSGGIQTGGSTSVTVTGTDASIVSNYNIYTSGSTRITASGWVASNQGISRHGSTTITAGDGINESASIMPDPLLDKLSPPTLPAFPGDPIADFTPVIVQKCFSKPGYSPKSVADYTASPGLFCSSGSSVSITGVSGFGSDVFEFLSGQYKFNDVDLNVSLNGSLDTAQIDGGTYIFNNGSKGIGITGTTNNFIMKAGDYAFLDGAGVTIGGSAPNNVFCKGANTYDDCTMYFSGGGGLKAGGSNNITLYPGTYIFDGGKGLNLSGNSHLTFEPGTYQFYFDGGADLSFEGSSRIDLDGSPYVQMWFTGNNNAKTSDSCPNGANSSDLCLQGSTNFSIPSGEYYFNNGRVLAQGSSTISGNDIFLYFKGKSYLYSAGSASFGFTAPTTEIYPGYYPGVFMYADRTDTSQFTWTGSTSSVSQGIVYIPSSRLVMTGSSSSKMMTGQIIADSFSLSGSNGTSVDYHQYVETTIPRAFLVQ